MKLFTIVRTNKQTGKQDVCVGSSPLTGDPYWDNPELAHSCSPLLIRSEHYAKWCRDLCHDKDTDEGGRCNHEYTIAEVQFPELKQA